MALENVARGAFFFSWFLPSFTKLGYAVRKSNWDNQDYDFSGQNWVVTGATSGIGRSIAISAAAAGARVWCVGRNATKLSALGTAQAHGDEKLESAVADLSLMVEVDQLAEELAAKIGHVDVLVNNVGLMLGERRTTQEGLEETFATNLLGHYLLTERLRCNEAINQATAVINMSSGGMYNVPLKLNKLQGGEKFNGTLTYAYHKRAMGELNAWWRQQGLNSYVMHPGWVDTPGVEEAMPEFYKLTKPLLRDAPAGADTALWLASLRPEQLDPTGVWFDRGLRAAHYLKGTDAGDDVAALLSYLDDQLTEILDSPTEMAQVATA